MDKGETGEFPEDDRDWRGWYARGMNHPIAAVYGAGVFRPLEPVALAEDT